MWTDSKRKQASLSCHGIVGDLNHLLVREVCASIADQYNSQVTIGSKRFLIALFVQLKYNGRFIMIKLFLNLYFSIG